MRERVGGRVRRVYIHTYNDKQKNVTFRILYCSFVIHQAHPSCRDCQKILKIIDDFRVYWFFYVPFVYIFTPRGTRSRGKLTGGCVTTMTKKRRYLINPEVYNSHFRFNLGRALVACTVNDLQTYVNISLVVLKLNFSKRSLWKI